jgi:hypothetical protein
MALNGKLNRDSNDARRHNEGKDYPEPESGLASL